MACAAPPPVKKKAGVACDPATADCTAMTTGPKKEHNDGALKTTTGSPLEASDEAKKAKDAKAAGTTPTDEDKPAAGDGEPSTTTDIPLPKPRPDVPASSSSSSSGSSNTDDPLAGVGPKCTQLWACCANLRAAGITGSANQCDESALGNDELTCDIANENYKTPDDNYDPVCF
jgi:hypothetical protein